MNPPSTVRGSSSKGINVKAVLATLAAVFALVGLAAVVSVITQVRVIRAERRSDVVRNLREAR